jgi:hypothetical protein
MTFNPISAGTMADRCFICHERPGHPLVLPDRVQMLCDCCSRQVPQSAMNVPEPEAKLFCPVCGMETTVVGTDAVMHFPTSKAVDYVIGPYGAVCSRCFTFSRTIHPSPQAALNFWRDYPEAIRRRTTP